MKTKFRITYLFLLFALCSWQLLSPALSESFHSVRTPFTISSQVLDAHRVPFVPHVQNKNSRGASFLSMNIPYTPIAELRRQVEFSWGENLSAIDYHQGHQAHIMVITPQEVELLKPHVTIEEINRMAAREIQKVKFQLGCLGVKSKQTETGRMNTYYLTVMSRKLLNFRTTIARMYDQRSGTKGRFHPRNYFAHITVGYTHQNLFFDRNTNRLPNRCIADVQILWPNT